MDLDRITSLVTQKHRQLFWVRFHMTCLFNRVLKLLNLVKKSSEVIKYVASIEVNSINISLLKLVNGNQVECVINKILDLLQ